MKTRKNQFDIEWHYALTVWTCLANGTSVPARPSYNVWEIHESTGKEKLIKQIPCTMMHVCYNESWSVS